MLRIGVAFLLFLAVIAGSALLFVRDDGDSTQDGDGIEQSEWEQALAGFFDRAYRDVIYPMDRASGRLKVNCPELSQSLSSPECAVFVDEIKRMDARFIGVIDNLKSLIANPHAEAPESDLDELRRLLDSSERAHRSNELIVEGWSNADPKTWAEGWDLRESLSEEQPTSVP